MQNKLVQNLIIPCYDADSEFRLKPASFMDLAQEIANVHAQILGFGYDDMQRTRTIWVLSRMHVRFEKYPMWRDEINLATWHKGPAGLFYLRDFQITGSNGEVLVNATTSWLVVDMDTRHIRRDANVLDEGTSCKDNAIERNCDKVQMPSGMQAEKVAEHIVSYSDVDMNGHTNNARYLVWAMDSLGYDFLKDHPVKEFRIAFNTETRSFNTVEIYRADIPAAEAAGTPGQRNIEKTYIEGKVDGKSSFCVELCW